MNQKYLLNRSLLISVQVLLQPFLLQSFTINLPSDFCSASEVIQSKSCSSRTVEITSQYPVFLVLIHGTFSNQDSFLDKMVLNKNTIPSNFFSNNAYSSTLPIRLSFGWSGENNHNARHEGGKNLAQGINTIIESCSKNNATPAFILIAHSHGGNVVAVASNFVKQPIDYAISLATPVLRYNQNEKTGTDNDLYLPRSIKNLFLFYSMQDIVQVAGAAGQEFKRRYGPIKGINLYNTRLLLNGQEPDHSTLYTQVIEDNILQLCSKIKNLYIKNKNLVANLAPKNPTVDKLIAIKEYDAIKINPFTGKSTDGLWGNWQDFTYSPQEPDEAETSNNARTAFNNFYHHEFTETASLIDRTLKAVQQEVCNRAIGKLGRSLSLVPSDQLTDIAKTCCEFNTFKELHPHATDALSCSAQPQAKPLGNQAFCLNVVGVPGRYLDILPDTIIKDLNKRCCSAEFKNQHPKASEVLGCH